jgi:hypothetical protein
MVDDKFKTDFNCDLQRKVILGVSLDFVHAQLRYAFGFDAILERWIEIVLKQV